MFRLRHIAATATLALGLTAAAPAFARNAPVRNERNDRPAARVENHDVRDVLVDRRVEQNVRVENNVRVNRDVHFDRDIHVDRNVFINRDVHFDRDHVRFGIGMVFVATPVYIDPGCEQAVVLDDVPACVLGTVDAQGLGPIQSVQFVSTDGRAFYRVIVAGNTGNLDVRVGVDGRLLSIEGC